MHVCSIIKGKDDRHQDDRHRYLELQHCLRQFLGGGDLLFHHAGGRDHHQPLLGQVCGDARHGGLRHER